MQRSNAWLCNMVDSRNVPCPLQGPHTLSCQFRVELIVAFWAMGGSLVLLVSLFRCCPEEEKHIPMTLRGPRQAYIYLYEHVSEQVGPLFNGLESKPTVVSSIGRAQPGKQQI